LGKSGSRNGMKKRRRRGGEEERRGKKIAGGSESRGWRKEPKGLKEGSRRPQSSKEGGQLAQSGKELQGGATITTLKEGVFLVNLGFYGGLGTKTCALLAQWQLLAGLKLGVVGPTAHRAKGTSSRICIGRVARKRAQNFFCEDKLLLS
jgi:hypothetical protein